MYRVKLTPTAGRMFNSLNPTVKKQLKSMLKELYENPYLGKQLRDELIDLRSLLPVTPAELFEYLRMSPLPLAI